jgi:hypothetical protein
MKTLLVTRTANACLKCTPDVDSLKGSYVDGPQISAVLDLSRWENYRAWEREVVREHGKGWGYSMRRAHKAKINVERCEISNWVVDRVAIDHSMPVRQGRPMGAGYRQTLEQRGGAPTTWKDDELPTCSRHWRLVLGAFVPAPPRIVAGKGVEKKLVAYLSLVRSDNLLIESQILGHKAFLADGCMIALQTALLAMVLAPDAERPPPLRGIEIVLYGAITDGTDGLKHWKRRAGFEPALLTVHPSRAGK